MFNQQAFALGFKEACARNGVPCELLIKFAVSKRVRMTDPHGAQFPETAQMAANVAMGAPMEPPVPALGELVARINSLGMYGSPGTQRQPFGS